MGAREVFVDYSRALDRADLTAMAELIHDDFHLEGAGLDGVGKQAYLAAMKAQLEAFTGYSENPTDIVEDGDVVHFVAHVTGTHTGTLALPGMAAFCRVLDVTEALVGPIHEQNVLSHRKRRKRPR